MKGKNKKMEELREYEIAEAKKVIEDLACTISSKQLARRNYESGVYITSDMIYSEYKEYCDVRIDKLTEVLKYIILGCCDEASCPDGGRITLFNSIVNECYNYGIYRGEHLYILARIDETKKLKQKLKKFPNKYSTLTVLKELGVELKEL